MRIQTTSQEDYAPGIITAAPWRVAQVTPLPDFRLYIRFNDGTEGYADLSHFLTQDDMGVFAPLRDPNLFKKVHIEMGTVTWPNEIDLAPDTMYDAIKETGIWNP